MRAVSVASLRGDLLGVDLLLARDLARAHVTLRGDAGLGDRALVGDPRLFDRLARGDLGGLGLGLALGALAGQFGALLGAADLDVAFLREPRLLALALDVEHLLFGLEVAGADLDHRVLLDVVAQLAALLDVPDQRGQALGVEAVGRVEIFQRGLVDVDDRDAFQLQPVLLQILLRQLLDPRHIGVAVLVHLAHRHLGGDGAQRALELARQQAVQVLRLQRAAPQRRRGHGDRRLVGRTRT